MALAGRPASLIFHEEHGVFSSRVAVPSGASLEVVFGTEKSVVRE